jgi:hypothetical protein
MMNENTNARFTVELPSAAPKICCHQICNGPNQVMAAWRASRDLQNKTEAGFSGSHTMWRNLGFGFVRARLIRANLRARCGVAPLSFT